jgi:hypothetical protein
MIVRYRNHQDKYDVLNEKAIEQPDKLVELLHRRRNRRPFFAELFGDNSFKIMFGISTELCCVQHSRINGDPPYLMAVSPHRRMMKGCVEFLAGGTLTPVAARYIISFDELKEIALYFLQTGERSNAVSWQILNLKATSEDAEGWAKS